LAGGTKQQAYFLFLTIQNKMLGLLVPKTELFLGNIVSEMVAFAAALYATLVGGAFARGVPAAAVLQQTWVPLQTQAVCTETRLPQVFSRVTRLEAGHLCCLDCGFPDERRSSEGV